MTRRSKSRIERVCPNLPSMAEPRFSSPSPPSPSGAEPLKWITCHWVGNKQDAYYVVEVTGDETIPELKALLREAHGIDPGIVAFSTKYLTTERLRDIPDFHNLSELQIAPPPAVPRRPGPLFSTPKARPEKPPQADK
jgi:hypothetical protein